MKVILALAGFVDREDAEQPERRQFLTDEKFILHLKESECRFNHRGDDFASFIEHIFLSKIKRC